MMGPVIEDPTVYRPRLGDPFLGHPTVEVLSVTMSHGQIAKKLVNSKLELDWTYEPLNSIGSVHFGSVHRKCDRTHSAKETFPSLFTM